MLASRAYLAAPMHLKLAVYSLRWHRPSLWKPHRSVLLLLLLMLLLTGQLVRFSPLIRTQAEARAAEMTARLSRRRIESCVTTNAALPCPPPQLKIGWPP